MKSDTRKPHAVTSSCRKEIFAARCDDLIELIDEMAEKGDIFEGWEPFMEDFKIRVGQVTAKFRQCKQEAKK